MQYGIGELCTSRRDKSLDDESIWSFIERRFDAQIADNMVDPIFKGIVAGDVKNLSAASLLKAFWEYEAKYGSIAGGMIVNTSRYIRRFLFRIGTFSLLLLLKQCSSRPKAIFKIWCRCVTELKINRFGV